jgi:hypothetical protein
MFTGSKRKKATICQNNLNRCVNGKNGTVNKTNKITVVNIPPTMSVSLLTEYATPAQIGKANKRIVSPISTNEFTKITYELSFLFITYPLSKGLLLLVIT